MDSQGSDTSALSLNIFVDALGYGVAQEHEFLPELECIRQPVRTVLGYSSGAVPTILTGVLPRVHGQWSFYYWDPEGSPFKYLQPLQVLPHRIVANHRLRNPLSRLVARLHGYTGYFNLYAAPFSKLGSLNWCEKRDIFAAGGLNGCPTILDAWRWAGVQHHVSDWRRPEDENIAAAAKAVSHPECRAAFVYIPGLDAALHRVGRRGAASVLPKYANAVREIWQAARKIHRRVRLRVFSDHGMADVVRNVDLMKQVAATGLVWGKDYAAVYDSTMVRIWILKEAARAPLCEALLASGAGDFVPEEVLAASGLNFQGGKYGHLIFLCHPGTLVVPSDMGLGTIAGMHGYSEDHADSDAVLLSNEPLATPVARIDDLNAMMRADFGIPRAAGAAPVEHSRSPEAEA
jgi:hypothetical protein